MAFTTTQLRYNKGAPAAPQAPTVSGAAKDASKQEDLQRVLRYVGDSWFPANPDLLRELRRSIKEKKFENSDQIIVQIRKDLALFGYCMNAVRYFPLPDAGDETSLERMRMLRVDQFDELLPVSVGRISRHSIDSISDLQVRRLQQAVMGISIAETLGEKGHGDGLDSYLFSFCRQLGLNLVSWNYPRVFQKLFDRPIERFGDFEKELTSVLGFSPLALGYHFAAEWGMPRDILTSLQAGCPDAAQTAAPVPCLRQLRPAHPEARGERLLWHSHIAEAIALGADAQYYPYAEEEWAGGMAEVSTFLGPGGLSSIVERVRERWAPYVKIFPRWYENIISENGRCERGYSEFARDRYDSNPFIAKCPKPLQDTFSRAYRTLVEGRASEESLKTIVGELIPAAGYHTGCIYLVNTNSMSMRPTIYIGEAREVGLIPIYTVRAIVTMDPLLKAFTYNHTVKGSVVEETSEVLYYAGSLGDEGKRAVLYLETKHPAFLSGEADPLNCFKAIQRALQDALGLGEGENH